MISIAILGSDSTHSQIFGEILQMGKAVLGVDVAIKALWGEDSNQAYQRARSIGLEGNVESIEQALEGVDLALVLGRFGDSHLTPAKAAIARGVATFVDKPFTSSFRDAQELVALARNADVLLSSASALRFANEISEIPAINDRPVTFVTALAPANCTDLGNDPRLNSVLFYGVHSMEMLLQIMGPKVLDFSVSASRMSVSAILRFPTGDAALHLIRDADEFYQINWHGRSRHLNLDVALDGTYNLNLIRSLLKSVSDGRTLVDHTSTLTAIEVLTAMEQANLSIENNV